MSKFTETHDEKIVDQAVAIMGRTIPEDRSRAMKNYVDILILLHKLKDPRKEELVESFRDLYVLPDREWHNNVLSDLSDFRETLYREKMDGKGLAGFGDDAQIIYNPPSYYQSGDPSQVPMQIGPLWPGFSYGQRSFTQSDAERMAEERRRYMEQRAETTDVPEYKYISPEGQLPQPQRELVSEIRRQEATNRQGEEFSKFKKSLAVVGLVTIALKVIF